MVESSDEISEGGSEILRHNERNSEWQSPDSSRSVGDEIEAHFESAGVEVEAVLHELVSDTVHIDIHLGRPGGERDYWTLFTTGMSDIPMNTPEGREQFALAELVLCLPPDWEMTVGEDASESSYWPIRLLKNLARFPHLYETWLRDAHTIPNNDPPEPYAASVEFAGTMLTRPFLLADDFHCAQTRKGTVNLWAVVPVYSDEMDYKLKRGSGALYDCFEKAQVTELLDPNRPSCLPRKKFLGLF